MEKEKKSVFFALYQYVNIINRRFKCNSSPKGLGSLKTLQVKVLTIKKPKTTRVASGILPLKNNYSYNCFKKRLKNILRQIHGSHQCTNSLFL